MTVYLTSDLHFNHDSIVKYCNRPCSVENHDAWLLETLNSQINDNDIVYHVGDLALYRGKKSENNILSYLGQLNGKWKLIPGNHDENKLFRRLVDEFGDKFEILQPIHELKMNKQTIVMCHFPIQNWNKMRYGSIHLHGHMHNVELNYQVPNRHNVCFDYNDFKVLSLDKYV